jgi:hypothetical protein
MPPGTPPEKVLEAVKMFAREEFGLKHRYSMVLHTDEPHPHVHMVVKAISEHGLRLNIRKAMLRKWRGEFARHLRVLGVPANATDRVVRGEGRSPGLDAIYRAERSGELHRPCARADALWAKASGANLRLDMGDARLLVTRREVERGWRAVAEILQSEGQPNLAAQVRSFSGRMMPPRTARKWISEALEARFLKVRARDAPGR